MFVFMLMLLNFFLCRDEQVEDLEASEPGRTHYSGFYCNRGNQELCGGRRECGAQLVQSQCCIAH